VETLDSRQRSTSDAPSRLGQRTYPPIPVETRLRARASQTLIEHWRVRSLGWKFPLNNEFAKPRLAQSECYPNDAATRKFTRDPFFASDITAFLASRGHADKNMLPIMKRGFVTILRVTDDKNFTSDSVTL
jgi:hypothetical protein